jgi:hypothetical protein
VNALDVIVSTRETSLSPTERLVLVHVALYANGTTGVCFASAARIAGDTGFSERTVRKAIASLLAEGALVMRPRPGQPPDLKVTGKLPPPSVTPEPPSDPSPSTPEPPSHTPEPRADTPEPPSNERASGSGVPERSSDDQTSVDQTRDQTRDQNKGAGAPVLPLFTDTDTDPDTDTPTPSKVDGYRKAVEFWTNDVAKATARPLRAPTAGSPVAARLQTTCRKHGEDLVLDAMRFYAHGESDRAVFLREGRKTTLETLLRHVHEYAELWREERDEREKAAAARAKKPLYSGLVEDEPYTGPLVKPFVPVWQPAWKNARPIRD